MRAESASVHPRVGGEHRTKAQIAADKAGSSPRGRGTPIRQAVRLLVSRFIPAWAGNTLHRVSGVPRRPVHPRVGGEHRAPSEYVARCIGSSPRGRGTPRRDTTPSSHHRFIPAWAGNTSRTKPVAAQHAVHPRVGGEHVSCRSYGAAMDGSSPRGRGTHHHRLSRWPEARFIPAWAGNTTPLPAT